MSMPWCEWPERAAPKPSPNEAPGAGQTRPAVTGADTRGAAEALRAADVVARAFVALALGDTSARQVSAATMPLAGRPWLFWKATTAVRVAGP